MMTLLPFRSVKCIIKYSSCTSYYSSHNLPLQKMENWQQPSKKEVDDLLVKNSFTKKKVPFIPIKRRGVTWYSCGPTVYDASHMGHARSYITFDILRRIMEDYFGYDVFYVMNITDIDDKARQEYLLKQYKEKNLKKEDILKDFKEAKLEYLSKALKDKIFDEQNAINKILSSEEESMLKYHPTLKALLNSGDENPLECVPDIFATWLDAKLKGSVNDQKIFTDVSGYWEKEFLKDMRALNIRDADVMTRVSEYVPEIVAFVEKIIENGYGYVANDGSVYFDTVAFDKSPNHTYAKLVPTAKGNVKLAEEGEGALSVDKSGKKSPNDFALWKSSKPGEPFWPSPWSNGRPGWHIECSAMACDVLGSHIDIHSGGIDLAFPHHDNELAQSEAHYGCSQWVNYFFHAGHLHIRGQKMSKSLKNFITIREVLEKYSSRQIRIMFLMHSWNEVLDYQDGAMEAALGVESTLVHFFLTVQALGREASEERSYYEKEKKLMQEFLEKKDQVDAALRDNFDTPTCLRLMLDLVNKANVYIKDGGKNSFVLSKIVSYIDTMCNVFGLVMDTGKSPSLLERQLGQNVEEILSPYLTCLARFRDSVRDMARAKSPYSDILSKCDELRDEELIDLDVILEDREGASSLIKLADKNFIKKIREEKALKKLEKEQSIAKREQEKQEKLEKSKINPKTMFLNDPSFSAFDENGIPTHDENKQELAKSRIKKLTKQWETQLKLYEKYLKESE